MIIAVDTVEGAVEVGAVADVFMLDEEVVVGRLTAVDSLLEVDEATFRVVAPPSVEPEATVLSPSVELAAELPSTVVDSAVVVVVMGFLVVTVMEVNNGDVRVVVVEEEVFVVGLIVTELEDVVDVKEELLAEDVVTPIVVIFVSGVKGVDVVKTTEVVEAEVPVVMLIGIVVVRTVVRLVVVT